MIRAEYPNLLYVVTLSTDFQGSFAFSSEYHRVDPTPTPTPTPNPPSNNGNSTSNN